MVAMVGSTASAAASAPLTVADCVRIARDAGLEVIVLDQTRPTMALYVGGMGARGQNFYNDVARAYGYEKEAEIVQDLYLAGRKDEAAAAIPQEWLELSNFVGPEGFVRERVAAYAEAGVTVLMIRPTGPDPVADVERMRSIVDGA